MNMPIVADCEIEGCAYNTDGECHAIAITVGDGTIPHCDTFCQMPTKGGDMSTIAGVGACKVSSCVFNKSLECGASEISIGYQHNDVECLNYTEG